MMRMKRPRSSASDTSDANMEEIAETELERLKRQYRIMENDRSAYVGESMNHIRKQNKEVKNLENEKAELLKDLRLAESRNNQMRDEEHTGALVTLVEAKDDYDAECQEEKKRCAELDAKIRDWEKRMRQQRRNMGGCHMAGQHTVQTQKTIRTLEDRLDTSKGTFNRILTDNAQLRDDIEGLRIKRNRFEQLYKKLEKELTKLRKEKGELIESSTQAYDARDEAQAKMIILKEKADKDMQQHNAEMKELIRIIDHDRKLKEFMGIKGQERQEDPQLVAWRQRKATEAERKKESQEDSIDTYEAAIERVKEITGEEDLDLLVTHFIEVEDKNFALFNYVNEQNNDIEFLHEQIAHIKYDIETFKDESTDMECERKKILKQLEERQTEASSEADELEQKNKEVSKILAQLRAGVDSLFNKINCDRTAIDEMLGASSGVTDTNMMQYLGIIEQRTNELLSVQAYHNSKDYEKYDPKTTTGLLGEGPAGPQSQIPVFPPTVGDEYESEASDMSDEEARPLTRNELQNRVMRTVKKRESAARKEGYKYDLSNAREKAQKQKQKDMKK